MEWKRSDNDGIDGDRGSHSDWYEIQMAMSFTCWQIVAGLTYLRVAM